MDQWMEDQEEAESDVQMIQPLRLRQLLEAAHRLRAVLDGEDVSVTLLPHMQLATLSANVCLLTLENATDFAWLMGMADCTEFQPKLDGTLDILFTFCGMFVAL